MSAPYRKKLIEVALPLEDINAGCADEKAVPRHGHPATLHLWWARRPLAAARAILFGQLVDDPGAWPEVFPTEAEQDKERQRLFDIIRELVKWEKSNDEAVVYRARFEIARSHARTAGTDKGRRILALAAERSDLPDSASNEIRTLLNEYLGTELPAVHDPFAGGGTIPLEAQRLGLRAIASDLNPVAVLINKALIEIPPRFAGESPVNPESQAKAGLRTWKGAEGLAEDVRYYGRWMREEAWKRIGNLYPKVDVPVGQGGGQATVIAWLWARTVASPNPAFAGIHVPLVSTFWLSKKEGKETWVEPVVDGTTWRFEVRFGKPKDPLLVDAGTKLGRGANFRCLLSGTPIESDYVKSEGMAKRMGARLMAIVADGKRQRLYLSPVEEHERVAVTATPEWAPEGEVPSRLTGGTCYGYGLTTWADLFTSRQLVALTTFSDLVIAARTRATDDARTKGLRSNDSRSEADASAVAYGDAVSLLLAFAVDKLADWSSTVCGWMPPVQKLRNTFARQAIPMVWDYAETNAFSDGVGNLANHMEWVADAMESLGVFSPPVGQVSQQDVASLQQDASRILSTDPPYYDNIGYADLSDFFYVWLRRILRPVFPDLFATMVVPKTAELIASPHRHGGREGAERFFLAGMTRALANLALAGDRRYPVTIYYAFRQSESSNDDGDVSSTGWETFLNAVLEAGFSLDGTWPVRTERGGRSNEVGANALASSVVLVCRQRGSDATAVSRADFRRLLRTELPAALKSLQHGYIAPVDMAQASIGPGMAIFSRHSKVIEADGSSMTVRTALQLINQALDEYLSAQEGDLDSHTRFGVTWFEAHGFDLGPYGVAETLAKARNVSVQGVEQAGLIKQSAGKVRLLKRDEMPGEWDPAGDDRLTVWEATQHLIKRLESGGEHKAALLIKALGSTAEQARDLAYRLYSVCERKGWSDEARAYNGLVVAWPELQKLASATPMETPGERPGVPRQASLALHDEPLFRDKRGRRKAVAGGDKGEADRGSGFPSPRPSVAVQKSLALNDDPLFRGKAGRGK